jgi:hypothetical protein
VHSIATKHNITHVSLCMEMSLHGQDRGRVHFHGMLSSAGQRRRWEVIASECRWGQHSPHVQHSNRAKGVGEGHYYAQAPKLGSLHRSTTFPRAVDIGNQNEHVALGVKAAWVLGLWRLKKLTHETAKAELLLTRDRAPKWMLEVDAQQQLEVQDQLRRAQVERGSDLCVAALEGTCSPRARVLEAVRGATSTTLQVLGLRGGVRLWYGPWLLGDRSCFALKPQGGFSRKSCAD